MLKLKKYLKSIIMFLCLTIQFSIIMLIKPQNSVYAIQLESTFDLEELNIGNLGGQNGWFSSSGSSVVNSPKYDGIRAIRLFDNSTSTFEYVKKYVAPLEKGTIRWYASVEQDMHFIMRAICGNSNTIFGVGFGSDGKFIKQTSTFVDISNDNYELNTWYKFSITFDCKGNKYDITIVKADLTGPFISIYDNATVSSNNNFADNIRFLTSAPTRGIACFDQVAFLTDSRSLMDEGFESYTTGNLNNQGAWTVSGSSVVIENVGAFSGSKVAKIIGNISENVSVKRDLHGFNYITSEVWAKASQTNRELCIVGSTGMSESFKLGFGNDGKFFYFNGTTRMSTNIAYSQDTWYRIRVNTYGSVNAFVYKMQVVDLGGTSIFNSNFINMCTTSDVTSYIDSIEMRTLPGSSSTFYFDEWTVRDHDIWYNQTFEGMSTGNIQAKEGWNASDSNASTVQSNGAVEGKYCLTINDTSMTNAYTTYVSFPDFKTGIYEYWINASQTDQTLYMRIMNDGKVAVQIVLAKNGYLYVYDGSSASNTNLPYNANNWYKCVVVLDCIDSIYDFYVYDKKGLQLIKVTDRVFYNNVTAVNKILFQTHSTGTGIFLADDISIINTESKQEKDVFNNINQISMNGNWYKDSNNDTGSGLLTWAESSVLSSYLYMFEAYADTEYLNKFINHMDSVLNQRDNVRGVVDYKGNSEKAWREDGASSIAESIIKDINRYDTLKIRSVRAGNQNGGTKVGNDNDQIRFNISKGANNGTFKLNIHSHLHGYDNTYDNLTMDFNSSNYVLTRINGIDPLVAVWDMNSESPISERNPIDTEEENLIPRYLHILVNNGYLAIHLGRFVDIVYNTSALYNNPTYKSKADTYKTAVTELLNLFEPFWVDEGSEGYYKFEYGAPIWSDGADGPINHVVSFGTAWLYLYSATSDAAYRDRAEHIANFFKNDLEYDVATDSYRWTYANKKHALYNGWSPGTVSLNTQNFLGYRSTEDISHGKLDLVFAYIAYKKGVIFNAMDMNRFKNTFLNTIVKNDGSWSWSVYGTGKCDFNEFPYGIPDWLILTEFDQNVYYVYKDLVDKADITSMHLCLNASAYLNWAKTKLP